MNIPVRHRRSSLCRVLLSTLTAVAAAFYNYDRHHPGMSVNYSAIGSGGGIQQLQNATVNFGASDVPMTSSELQAAQGSVLQIPVDLGGEAIVYNVAGVKTGLHLTGSLLAQIYLGQVTNWDASPIRALNPGVKLPDEQITVVHRSDGSGTTYIFTNYLSSASKMWANTIGMAKTINWPVGVGGDGSQGVAGLVTQIPGAIGYVELAYALENHFCFAAIENAAGKFVLPSQQTVAADAAERPRVTAIHFSIVNQPGATSYPIAGYSWILVYQHQRSAAVANSLASLVGWLTHAGQGYANDLGYVPLPKSARSLATATLSKMTGPSGHPINLG
jgi:phosphate transport system substrate-binding protein